MITQQIGIVICVVVLILLIYFAATFNNSTYEKYIYGFWTADGDEFCESAEIESMLVFIGEEEKVYTWTGPMYERNCYLIIMNDLANQGFKLTYSRGWSGVGLGKYSVRAKVTFDDEPIWTTEEDGDNVTLTVDITNGTLKIKGGDTVFARLNKQHDITNAAIKLEGDECELVNDDVNDESDVSGKK